MGWGFRKSVNFGPVRINFSKRGISSSVGVKGARLSFNRNGTFINLGAKGFYYRKKLSGRKRPPHDPAGSINSANSIRQHKIDYRKTNPLAGLTDKESLDFIRNFYLQKAKTGYSTIFMIAAATGLLALFIFLNIPFQTKYEKYNLLTVSKKRINVRKGPGTDFAIIAKALRGETFKVVGTADSNSEWTAVAYSSSGDSIAYIYSTLGDISDHQRVTARIYPIDFPPGTVGFFWMTIILLVLFLGNRIIDRDKKRRSIDLGYTIGGRIGEFHDHFISGFNTFCRSEMIWEKTETFRSDDRRYHGGAESLISRTLLSRPVAHKLPYENLITNIRIPCIITPVRQYYFLPERLIIRQGSHYAGILYKNLSFSKSDVSFVESDKVADDSEVIDYTWQYTNKHGGRDRRFRDNQKLPVCRYSEYAITSESGLLLIIQSSLHGAMDEFMDSLGFIAHFQTENLSWQN